ncbi:hypothetical protein Syun_002153 [Stephania yunnanensis]|uniref:Uncharacterized protein n=1 Tax=Stephania yunnanensis TaxID=152371 RepID=A0AAP0LEW1_9MAGN
MRSIWFRKFSAFSAREVEGRLVISIQKLKTLAFNSKLGEITPEMVLQERYRVCKLEQNCRESGIWPERSICGSWRVMKRFSPSFQLEAPTKLQLKPTLSLLKVHDESLRCGSHKVSLTPRRRLTSSSRDSTKTTMRIAKTLARIEALEYSVQVCLKTLA